MANFLALWMRIKRTQDTDTDAEVEDSGKENQKSIWMRKKPRTTRAAAKATIDIEFEDDI